MFSLSLLEIGKTPSTLYLFRKYRTSLSYFSFPSQTCKIRDRCKYEFTESEDLILYNDDNMCELLYIVNIVVEIQHSDFVFSKQMLQFFLMIINMKSYTCFFTICNESTQYKPFTVFMCVYITNKQKIHNR